MLDLLCRVGLVGRSIVIKKNSKKLIPNHDMVIHLACISNDPSFELNPELGKSINLDAFRPLVAQSGGSRTSDVR